MLAEPAQNSGQILIVDSCEDSREVLRTMLQRRGFPTLEANRATYGAELARCYHPRVIVLDIEAESAEDESVRQQYESESENHDARLIVIGRFSCYDSMLPRDRVVAKPYHFAPLLRTIENLLGAQDPATPVPTST